LQSLPPIGDTATPCGVTSARQHRLPEDTAWLLGQAGECLITNGQFKEGAKSQACQICQQTPRISVAHTDLQPKSGEESLGSRLMRRRNNTTLLAASGK